MKNLERVVLRQSQNVSSEKKQPIKIVSDNSVSVVKRPSPVYEKQVNRTNAELRNTKKIVQVISKEYLKISTENYLKILEYSN